MTSARYWAIVPAAGSGQRFGAELAKQFQTIAGRTVADHTLNRLLSIPALTKIIVPCEIANGGWQQVAALQDPRVQRVAGGEQRVHSVLLGLHALSDIADDQDWVLVHDMARPCITAGDIKKLMTQLVDHAVGGILATPVSDTLKQVTASSAIQGTLDRSHYWAAQTPQMFRYGLLLKAFETMLAAQQVPTDEASAIEYLGEQPAVVAGRRDNIKITHREDMIIAEAIMAYQESEQCV